MFKQVTSGMFFSFMFFVYMLGPLTDVAVYRKVMEALQNEIRLQGANLNMTTVIQRQIQTLVGKYFSLHNLSRKPTTGPHFC